MGKNIIFASNNQHKIQEVKSKLKGLDINLLSQKEAGYDIEVEETGKTFAENAELKARAIYNLAKVPVVADDSGLEVDFLNGEPGVYSARYCGEGATSEQKYNKILNLMEDAREGERSARFKCVICYIDNMGESHLFEGVCEGEIAKAPMGSNNFGYDPIFLVGDTTFASMSQEEKNLISHRGRAIEKWVEYLKK